MIRVEAALVFVLITALASEPKTASDLEALSQDSPPPELGSALEKALAGFSCLVVTREKRQSTLPAILTLSACLLTSTGTENSSSLLDWDLET